MRAIMAAEKRNETASASTTAGNPPTAKATPPTAGPISRERCCETPIREFAWMSSAPVPSISRGTSATCAGWKSC